MALPNHCAPRRGIQRLLSSDHATEIQIIAMLEPPAALAIVGIVTLVLVVIELIVVFQLRNGKNWARVMFTILEALGLLGLLSGTGLIQIFWAVISVVIIVLMWVPTSNAYFAAQR